MTEDELTTHMRRMLDFCIQQREEVMTMPLTQSGKKVLRSMKKQYGTTKGKSVFYASINKGKLKGMERKKR